MKIQQSFREKKSCGTLFLVPTPIGNLNDMTLRGIDTLRSVDLIAAEDTRNTQKLLNHFDIHTPQESFHEHNWAEKIPQLIEFLHNGRSIAQVSDAGMPSISDPGHELVEAVINEKIPVVALPGASAGITALIASGLVPQPFIFYGFLPRKKQQQVAFFEEKKNYPETQIFYESPYRVMDTLTTMQEIYGDREGVLVRELTKLYEEYRRGKLSELLSSLTEIPAKGECLLIISGNTLPKVEEFFDSPLEAIAQLVESGIKVNDAIKQVARLRQLNRQELYRAYHKFQAK